MVLKDTTALVPVPQPAETGVTEWTGAADRGLRARREREKLISDVLVPDVDYGKLPGMPADAKPMLYQPGAQKVSDALNLWPDYEALNVTEDFELPLFHYRYRCTLRQRGTDAAVASGIGSCNSREAKYRWREGRRVCPKCGSEAIIKGKEEYGGGWLCFAKKGGCGAKFIDGDRAIEGQTVGRVENDDIASVVNTVDKIAQKRAMVAAALSMGFSEQFTQDEDTEDAEERPARATRKKAEPKSVAQPKTTAEKTLPLEGTWTGTVAAAEKRTSKSSGKPFVLVRGGDGVEFCSFSESVIADAVAAADVKAAARIAYKTDSKGYRMITSLDPDEGPTQEGGDAA